jgi:signal transduction histidine kinase/ABC-type uncharacterized transport system substrate-binding protein
MVAHGGGTGHPKGWRWRQHRIVGRVVAFAFGVALFVSPCSSLAGDTARRVLVLSAYSMTYPGVMSVAEGAIQTLTDRSPEKIELLSDFLDLARFSDPDQESRTARYLADKYAINRPDVVITAGREASQFILNHRNMIAPEVPVVVCCMSAQTFAAVGASNKITGVISGRDISKTLDLAERLQPGVRNLVVIAGAADFDRQWVEIANHQIGSRGRRYNTRYLVGLSYESLIEEVSRLPRDTIAITLTYFADDQGKRYVSPDVVSGVAKVASAPVYSPYATSIGSGIVGGYSDLNASMGTQIANLALAILAGKDPNTIAPEMSTAGAYRVDARQLNRWQLSDAKLPPGTEVLFKKATIWDEHPYLVVSALGALGLQSAIIAYVVVQNRKRREAEKSLAENEERMAFTAASTNTGLWQLQVEDQPIWATKHCRTILGLPENTPLSLDTLRNSIHPDDRRALVRAMRDATLIGCPIDGEFRVVLPSDELRWIALKGYPHRRGSDGPYYINGVLSDVTALKMAEGEAEQQRSEIAHLLRQSIISELSGTLAHELNQPLTAILANAETAQDLLGRKSIDLEKIQEIVTDIIEEESRASEIVSRVRKLLRKGESTSEPIDLNQLMESTLHLLRGEFTRRKINVDVGLTPNLPTISGDPVQLQQVLVNVIMNAMDAVRSKAPAQRAINITTRYNGTQIEAAIIDSGPGIATENQARLFQPFFTTKERGLGLGLSICSRIIKSHGGRLSVENNADGGAKAVLALPARDILVPA